MLQSALQGPVTKLQGCAEQLIAFCQQRMGLQIPRSHAKCAWGFAMFCKTPIDGSQPHPRGDTFVKNRFCFVNTSLLFSLL